MAALNSKVKPCIEEAMNGWICATEVRFGLSSTVLSPFPQAIKDGVSTIQLGSPISSSGSSVLANTATWYATCSHLQSHLPIEYSFDIDIVFYNDPLYVNNFWYDETRLQAQPPILYDFYSIALHEFGHALLLKHVNQKEQIMKSGTQTSSYGFHYWDRKINLTPDDIAGAKVVVQESSNLQFSNCQGGAPIDVMVPLILNNCNMPTKINEVEGALSETVIYPNPVKEQLTISFPIQESSEVYFEIYTIDGKQIYQSVPQILDRGTQELFWNTSKISKGIYLVDLWINNQKQTLKWVKL